MIPQFQYVNDQTLDKNVFNRLSIRYILAVSAVALAIIASQIFVQKFLHSQLSDSRVVNVAGRQRMLSQKITKEALLLLHADDLESRQKAADELAQTCELWKRSHLGLLHGDSLMGLPGTNSEVILAMFDNISGPHNQMVASVRHILELLANQQPDQVTVEVLRPHVENILENEPGFLVIMDDMVFQYDYEAKNKVNRLIRIEIFILALALLILIFELIFIFWPTAYYTKRVVADLMQSEAREKKLGKEMLKKKTEEQKLRSSLIFEGQERERRRIARDLHDGIGQLLTGLKFQLEAIDADDPDNTMFKMGEIKNLSADIIKEVRRVSFNLRPSVLSDYGLPAVIRTLVQELNKFTDAEMEFHNLTGFDQRLDKKIETHLYRITQEAINNALKYAQAQLIIVELKHEDGYLEISVEDDGVGFDLDAQIEQERTMKSGHGLFNMRERAHFIDAELEIKTKPGKGTTVQVKLPI